MIALQIGETIALKYPKYTFENIYSGSVLSSKEIKEADEKESFELKAEPQLEKVAVSSFLGVRYGRILNFENKTATQKLISQISMVILCLNLKFLAGTAFLL